MNFNAFDFETGNPKRWSICQVGIVRVELEVVISELNLLVQPPNNEIWSRFTAIHGIHWQDTVGQPTFDQLWPQIQLHIEGQVVVAHNMGFDGSCLDQTLNYYDIPRPDFERQCTYRLYKKGLGELSNEYDIPLNHHDALSDARACAELYSRYIAKGPLFCFINLEI